MKITLDFGHMKFKRQVLLKKKDFYCFSIFFSKSSLFNTKKMLYV
jgi:hypothetical protein